MGIKINDKEKNIIKNIANYKATKKIKGTFPTFTATFKG
jgi:hypothetical protein